MNILFHRVTVYLRRESKLVFGMLWLPVWRPYVVVTAYDDATPHGLLFAKQLQGNWLEHRSAFSDFYCYTLPQVAAYAVRIKRCSRPPMSIDEAIVLAKLRLQTLLAQHGLFDLKRACAEATLTSSERAQSLLRLQLANELESLCYQLDMKASLARAVLGAEADSAQQWQCLVDEFIESRTPLARWDARSLARKWLL